VGVGGNEIERGTERIGTEVEGEAEKKETETETRNGIESRGTKSTRNAGIEKRKGGRRRSSERGRLTT
jgi:hypothetical protein